ncbi:uncharacterized protein LOC110108864 [Dendrobium catenatum]|uniref:uncharacterized protein LOC110108864 n=1 Tax=Dendrobium catenatum TaxID=906689 RepID=UPI0010A09100|nr:uncharacterized protein LOC110108864 [Dendrobium catenatum]
MAAWNIRGFNHPDKVMSCKRLIKSFRLNLVADKPLLQLSAIYASNNSLDRKELWNSLTHLAPEPDFPWVLIGDFNCCRYASEKLGGNPISHHALFDLNNMIFSNSLVDLHSVGFKFTWFNQRTINPIHIKLDRALVNAGWQNKFPNSYCSIQSPSCSDHCPIILNSGISVKVYHRFLFKNYWTNFDSFWAVLLEVLSLPCSGNSISHFSNCLKFLKDKVKSEDWYSSSCVFRHLDVLNDNHANLLSKLQVDPYNLNLNHSFKVSTVELAKFNSMYASWIVQRAKVNWIRNGEDDLKFLFAKIRTRRGCSNSMINLFANNHSSSRADVVSSLIQYYQILYNPSSPPSPNATQACFPSGTLLPQDEAIRMTSLVLDEEVIADRLKPVMPSIVMNNQAGFVKSRVSTDNILLASDILSFVGKERGKGFPSLSVNWIKACIFDVNFSIMLNGALEGFFPSSAGLRQGYPLSPYLFCLVMDAFSNLLECSGFKGISVDNFSLTHLLYADDVLIFGEASIENCNKLAIVLRDFANSTGLYVNYDKSAIMLTKNQRNVQAICQSLSIFNIVNKINYLGIPLSFYKLKIEDFLPLLDSINKKMNGWKANLLSFAGRLQYIKFTIQNTIAYWIRGSILPKTVYKHFKKACSKFLFFGDSTHAKKLHMVSWDRICRPKYNGGLGIPSISALQFSYSCSVILRMYNAPSPLSKWLICYHKSPWKPPRATDSKIWKLICNTAMAVKYCFTFSITQQAPIHFIWDHWCNNKTISEYLGGNPDGISHDFCLNELIIGTQWVIPNHFPLNLKNVIAGINIGDTGHCLLWGNRSTYKFKNFMDEYYSDIPSCSWFKLVSIGSGALLVEFVLVSLRLESETANVVSASFLIVIFS